MVRAVAPLAVVLLEVQGQSVREPVQVSGQSSWWVLYYVITDHALMPACVIGSGTLSYVCYFYQEGHYDVTIWSDVLLSNIPNQLVQT